MSYVLMKFVKSYRKVQLKLSNNNGHFTWSPTYFSVYMLWASSQSIHQSVKQLHKNVKRKTKRMRAFLCQVHPYAYVTVKD